MVTLLSFIIDSPPGAIQLIITELDSTPLTVLTIQWIACGLPTIAPCMGPEGFNMTVGVVTTYKISYASDEHTYVYCKEKLPVTSNVAKLSEMSGGF